MNSTEWNRIKNIRPSKGINTTPDGKTQDLGRNAMKRIARAKGFRHIGKAKRVLS